MILTHGPLEFLEGLPEGSETNTHTRRIIPRNFAIASKPLTIAQFNRFLGATGQPTAPIISPDLPATLDFYQAATYCNWLSEREGLGGRLAYPVNPRPVDGLTEYIPIRGLGYRAPTDGEHEYACGAGSRARHAFGDCSELLIDFCWCRENSGGQPRAVGSLRPNRLGLFDPYGNVLQWCHNLYADLPPTDPVMDSDTYVPSHDSRVVRGDFYDSDPAKIRSGWRARSLPEQRFSNIGLRVARTLDDDF
jgi:formylglycine-generating enzyme required for sulfatase activity